MKLRLIPFCMILSFIFIMGGLMACSDEKTTPKATSETAPEVTPEIVTPKIVLDTAPEMTDSAGAVVFEDLVHHRFEVVSLNGAAVFTNRPSVPEISFGENMSVSGVVCNRFSGTGAIASGKLTVEKMMSTLMACGEEGMENLERALFAMLREGVSIQLDDKTLTLSDETNTIVYTLRDLVQ